MHWFFRRCSLLAAALVAGCGLASSRPTATTPPSTPAPLTATVPAMATATEESLPTATAAAEAGVLPAPLYFISAADGQVWRVERDGARLTQITSELAPVTYFDVSPADGRLVYVAGNTFIVARPDGDGRVALFSGPQDFPEDETINSVITHPRWAPDGRRIVFGYAGIQIYDLDSPTVTTSMILPSDSVPDLSAGRPPATTRFYRQALWSPEGERLLVEFLHYPEGGGWAILPLEGGGALVEVLPPPETGMMCCEPTWSLDGRSVYFASPYIGLGLPGLWRVTAATGQTETLIAPTGEPGSETFAMVEKAQQLADGRLYYFLGTVAGFPTGAFTPLALYQADPATGAGAALRADAHTLEEVLWALDASGAVIMEVGPESVWPYHGPLTWLPADGSAAVRLPAEGASLAWGR